MALTAEELFEGLLQQNYFPAQKKDCHEIPPIFTSAWLVGNLVNEIIKIPLQPERGGFDCVDYTSLRFDFVHRVFKIPFPKPYIDLCNCIRKHWDEIKLICYNESSVVRPKKHPDGRVIIMNYEEAVEKEHWHITHSFSEQFAIHTDITNFYPSIYTHSIGWAAVGHEEAKKQSRNTQKWYNELDKFQRLTTRNETKGIPIGPATSNIITEFILQKIDKSVNEGLKGQVAYLRYIDDYKCYAKNREKAEDFIRLLRIELNKYCLHLNNKKTYILELPNTSDDSWKTKINMFLPKKNEPFNYRSIKRFLDYSVELSKKYSNKSVLKYAIKCVLSNIPSENLKERKEYRMVLDYIVNLSYYNPGLVSSLKKIFIPKNADLWEAQQPKMYKILKKSAENHRSEAIAWILYFSCVYKTKSMMMMPRALLKLMIVYQSCFCMLLNNTIVA